MMKISRLTALLLAGAMALTALPFAAMAEVTQPVKAGGGQQKTINDDVTSYVEANGNNAGIIVNGDITSQRNDAAAAYNGGTVYVAGNATSMGGCNDGGYGAYAQGQNSSVHVGGDAAAVLDGRGAFVILNGTITVDGDAVCDGSGCGANAAGGTITVKGNAIAGDCEYEGGSFNGPYGAKAGIGVYGYEGNVWVGKDAIAGKNGIGAYTFEGGTVTVVNDAKAGMGGTGASTFAGGEINIGGDAKVAGGNFDAESAAGSMAVGAVGGKISVDGSAVAGEGAAGVFAFGDEDYIGSSTVSIGKNVTSGGEYAIYAEGAVEIIVAGDAENRNGEGTVTDSSTTVYVDGVGCDAHVEIGGNVLAAASNYGVSASGSTTEVYVGGDIVDAAMYAAYGSDGSLVEIEGDAAGRIANAQGTVIIAGTLDGSIEAGATEDPSDEPFEIVLWKAEDPETMFSENSGMFENPLSEDELADCTYYVIRQKDMLMGDMNLSGAVTVFVGVERKDGNQNEYYTVKEEDTFIVTVTVPEGYRLAGLSAGDGINAVRNSDGSYSVTAVRGGGIELEALLKKIAKSVKKEEEPGLWILVEYDEETLRISSAGDMIHGVVKSNDMGYARRQIAGACFKINDTKVNGFDMTMNAAGELDIVLSEELFASFAADVQPVDLEIPNGQVFPFDITVA